jgi:hypothetical protein
MSCYGETITNLDKVFEEQDVGYLFYEDMMTSKQEHIDKITTLLEVEKVVLSEASLEKRVNETETYELPSKIIEMLACRLRHVYREVANRFQYVPQTWRYTS